MEAQDAIDHAPFGVADLVRFASADCDVAVEIGRSSCARCIQDLLFDRVASLRLFERDLNQNSGPLDQAPDDCPQFGIIHAVHIEHERGFYEAESGFERPVNIVAANMHQNKTGAGAVRRSFFSLERPHIGDERRATQIWVCH